MPFARRAWCSLLMHRRNSHIEATRGCATKRGIWSSPHMKKPLFSRTFWSYADLSVLFLSCFLWNFSWGRTPRGRNKIRRLHLFVSGPPCWGHLHRDPPLWRATQGTSVGPLEPLQLEGLCWPFPGDPAPDPALPRVPLSTTLSMSAGPRCHLHEAVLFAPIASCPYPRQSPWRCIQISALSVSLNRLEAACLLHFYL